MGSPCPIGLHGHGDVVQIVDTSGNIVNSYDYDVWGNFITKQETIDNPFTYFGQTFDETTGLYYLRARYYDPQIGRFTQQDPAEDGYNWYVYCSNNPIMFVDPLGLFGENTLLQIGTPFDNPDVIKLQKTLNNLGYVGENGQPLTVDGDFGANTEYAVKQFQTNNKLQVDGIVGKNTWSALGLEFDHWYDSSRLSVGIPEMNLNMFSITSDHSFFEFSNNEFVIMQSSASASFIKTQGKTSNSAWEVDIGSVDSDMGIGYGIEIGASASAVKAISEYSHKFKNELVVGVRVTGTYGSIGANLDLLGNDGDYGFSISCGLGFGVDFFIK